MSLPDLIRQSIFSRRGLCEEGWIRGSSPRMTSCSFVRLPLVFCPVQDARLFAVADEFPDRHRIRRRHSDGDALCIARPQAGDGSRAAARDLRAVAARQDFALSAGARFPPWDAARGAPDGIIVLGGSIEPDLSVAHGTPVVRGAPDRIIAAAALARRYPNARVVFSGGSANLVSNDAREADFAGAIFESLGVDKSRLIMERQSRNTQENAEFSKALVSAEGGRAMVAGDFGLSYAAVGRSVPKSGICGRALSGGLAGRRTDDLVALSNVAVEGLARTDLAVARMDGPDRISAHRQDR